MLFPSNLIKFRRIYAPLLSSQRFYRYYLVLPEIPTCTSQNNAILKAVETADLPPIATVSLNEAIEATAKLALELECFSTVHGNTFKDPRKERTFDSVIGPLNNLNVMLEYAWGTLRQKFLTDITPTVSEFIRMRIKHQGMLNLIMRSRHVQFNNAPLYRAVKEVAADNFDEWQTRLCDIFLMEGKMNGLEFRKPIDKVKLEEYRKLLRRKSQQFWLNMKQSSMEPEFILTGNDLIGTPYNLLLRWSTNREDLFEIPLDEESFASSQTYCRNRMKRFKMWEYWNLRSSFNESTALINNSLGITEIRDAREEESNLHGFKTYSEKMLVGKMAYSLDELEAFLTLLRDKASVKFKRRLTEMQIFASTMEMVIDDLKPWDYLYFARLLAEREMKFNQVAVSECFPFDETWKNLLSLAERLFDVRFIDVTTEIKVEPVDELISVFLAIDKKTGEEKGYLYLDPYCRNGKNAAVWTECGRTRDKRLNYLPIVYLNADVAFRKSGEQFIFFEQLIRIVNAFGIALVNLLCEAPYVNIYGSANVESDGSFVFGEVLKWIVLEPTVLHSLSGQRLSLVDCANARRFYVESSLPALVREIFLSEFDLTIHNTKTFWLDIWKEMHKSYYFKPMDKRDCYPCSFSAIMVDNFACSYYSRLFSEMIACDIVAAFQEAGFENEAALNAVGKRYRETYLNLGGGRHARDVFKMFRNRDLEFKHMVKFYNLG